MLLRSSAPPLLRSSAPPLLRSSAPPLLRSSAPPLLRSSAPPLLRSSELRTFGPLVLRIHPILSSDIYGSSFPPELCSYPALDFVQWSILHPFYLELVPKSIGALSSYPALEFIRTLHLDFTRTLPWTSSEIKGTYSVLHGRNTSTAASEAIQADPDPDPVVPEFEPPPPLNKISPSAATSQAIQADPDPVDNTSPTEAPLPTEDQSHPQLIPTSPSADSPTIPDHHIDPVLCTPQSADLQSPSRVASGDPIDLVVCTSDEAISDIITHATPPPPTHTSSDTLSQSPITRKSGPRSSQKGHWHSGMDQAEIIGQPQLPHQEEERERASKKKSSTLVISDQENAA
ncbi:hypothetical protein BDR07DRAFT_1493928 [Suillus spraguei]|nr:hypothetical protein BDR07DRAFT_1493928 [Suillus spraguei]